MEEALDICSWGREIDRGKQKESGQPQGLPLQLSLVVACSSYNKSKTSFPRSDWRL